MKNKNEIKLFHFPMNYTWVAAKNARSAMGFATSEFDFEETEDTCEEVSNEAMESLIYYDDLANQGECESRSFKEQFAIFLKTEKKFPETFAVSEG